MNPRFSYREAAVQGASRVRLVILLYEQAIEDLRRALVAQALRQIEVRTREIKHAILVLGHLQSSLDKDRGGQVAANLEQFYAQVRTGLITAQCQQSAAMIEQQISLLMQVRDAWCQVELAEAGDAMNEPAQHRGKSEPSSSAEWNA